MRSRSKLAFKNSLFLTIKEIVILICNLILPRLILSNYGSEVNGLISSITQFLSIVSIFRLGVSGSIRASLYNCLTKDDKDGVNSIISTSQNYMKKSGFLVIGYIVIVCFLYPIFVGSTLDYFEILVLVFSIGITVVAQYLFGITYSSLLSADQNDWILHITEAVVQLISTAIMCLLIIGHLPIVLVKFIGSIIWTIFPLFIFIFSKRKYSIQATNIKNENVIKNRKYAMTHSIANIIYENIDIWVLTIVCGPVVVSIYAVYRLVLNGIKKVLQILVGSLEAPFGELWAKNEKDKFVDNYYKFEFINNTFVSSVFPIVLLLLSPFISLYTKGISDAQYIDKILSVLIVICESIYCLRNVFVTIVQACGHYKQTKIHAIIEAVLNLVTTVPLVYIFGLKGAILGTIIANVYRLVAYLLYCKKNILQLKLKHFIKQIMFISINFILIYFTGYFINKLLPISGWGTWVLAGFVDVGIALIITTILSCLFFKEILFDLIRIIKNVFKNNKHEKKLS